MDILYFYMLNKFELVLKVCDVMGVVVKFEFVV